MLVVDAANVVGSRPDGWWRDRAGAADRLIAGIRTALDEGRLRGPVLVVLEGRARGAQAGELPGAPDRSGEGEDTLSVVRAPGSGDDRIVELVAEAEAMSDGVTVVTSDRGLMGRVQAHGAAIARPSAFWAKIGPAPTTSG